ncbi:dihydrolipoamide acetyltransferase family protein [Cryobacterium luteum]|uniref:Dihydrolipoamide acetyltransferase component of pyruvate dehydrogenase complex n=1 Tax=Cryobacterium luteum TaxID=1424661 RepID=A0A1H8KUL4_9MICO|nr:dihydrolipoamide acetyltransferase family protein [Cryobacterium luteum]TFB87783.1 2-oxo acid dehydrogenase subunit E2 [Cryobacterium luteum]SEN96559.1 pyruvate dehydrogenase E2 component (dihydrolipoamide acetyltransferase) [Cryobacterium luteum]
MIKVFKLPDLGEGLTESEIVAWLVAPGDEVTLNQHIADVETAKAVVELPSPFAGVVRVLHQPAGVVVHVGDPIVSFDIGGEPDPLSTADVAAPAAAATEQREANLVGYGPAVERGGHPQRRARAGSGPAAVAGRPASDQAIGEKAAPADHVPSAAPPAAALAAADRVMPDAASVDQPAAASTALGVALVGERPRSTPPVRALARDLGIDLTTVTGTGRDGLITRDDVRAHLTRSVPVPVPVPQTMPQVPSGALPGSPAGIQAATPAGAFERETRTPIRSLRKLTAAAMVHSAFTAPHVTEFLTIDVTPTLELLDSLRADGRFADAGIGILAVVAKALCLAVGRTPAVNARWDEPAGEIVQFHHVNLGIAAATPRGLLVPNIVDADRLDLRGLAAALAALTTAARAGTTTPAALAGGTITITNIGVFGIDAGTPILNPGEAAILALGAIRSQPWEYRGQVALRKVLTLSLSFDHRLVDGEQGSRFLADIATILADPARVLTLV